MSDPLIQYCPTCDEAVDIYCATVGPASPDEMHDVSKFELECGHTIKPDKGVQLSSTIVDLLNMTHPHAIEVTQF